MEQYKTPGVYINEAPFPNSVVQVPTAVPVFIGYTEIAKAGSKNLTNVPTKIGSFAEFEQFFGGAPAMDVCRNKTTGDLECKTPFLMHRSIRLFYENGGGDCYIVSVGGYTNRGLAVTPKAADLTVALEPLKETPEPTMVLTPDSAMMGIADWGAVAQEVLSHCQTTQSRVAILDLVNGDLKFGMPNTTDPVKEFQNKMRDLQGLDYAAAYYPWLNTLLIDINEITYCVLSTEEKADLAKRISAAATGPTEKDIKELASNITKSKSAAEAKPHHLALMTASPLYKETMLAALKAMNVMPPSGGMAGIISYTDNWIGPWKAPANVSMTGVVSPTVEITEEELQALDAPLTGLSVNAIDSFVNRGVLVWGARTLDGHSQDWRYLYVRRTAIMIEQSAKAAVESFVFDANDANTWVAVKAMLENFLINIWKQGALKGAKPEDAFKVLVGLGSTMTANDILNGVMNVTILVAVTRPAEFVELTFQQRMQKS